MTYPASPGEAAAGRVRPDSAQYWAGALATAVVAALIALVGILICRWTLHIPILAPAGDGAWGSAHTGEYALVAALIAIAAGGVLYLLMLGTPQPRMFFNWIMGLVTVVAVVYPFSTSAPVDQKGATAVVNLVLGLAITSLLAAVAARAVRYPARRAYPTSQQLAADQQRYAADQQRYAADQGYPAGEGYGPGQGRVEPPTRPIDVPPRRAPRR
jgi:hypothetical protein